MTHVFIRWSLVMRLLPDRLAAATSNPDAMVGASRVQCAAYHGRIDRLWAQATHANTLAGQTRRQAVREV